LRHDQAETPGRDDRIERSRKEPPNDETLDDHAREPRRDAHHAEDDCEADRGEGQKRESVAELIEEADNRIHGDRTALFL
jgi:hypothetical protein